MPHCICHTVYATLYMPHCICHTVYVTLYMSHCICHTVYVTLYMPHCICHTVYVTLYMPHCICHTVPISCTAVCSDCQDAKRCSVQDEAECVCCPAVSRDISLQSVMFLRNLLFGILSKQKREEMFEYTRKG